MTEVERQDHMNESNKSHMQGTHALSHADMPTTSDSKPQRRIYH
eukprot:CAMPEP_0204263252 /NCGR_PEP_ID=MMETSP0468-20130131/8226_1 /ASSEMBLY_ACC=CAM_ASM_000383 /TAXON_ID=2969 /ORGANISM="Oxyrrhis marina" /LENGTH=43 /DNA_ID= /DNA_START= /DNA_END= /DNA_ORIENTATION=